MNLRKTEKHEPLAPGRRLAGKKTPHLSVEGRVFLLTSPFIERAYRTSFVSRADALDLAIVSSIPSQRSTLTVEPAGLQLGQFVAPSGTAEEDSAVKNLAGALHADRVGCTLSVIREVKMEIPVKVRQATVTRRLSALSAQVDPEISDLEKVCCANRVDASIHAVWLVCPEGAAMPETRTSRSVYARERLAEGSHYDALYATGCYMTVATNVYEYCRVKTIHASLRKLAVEFSPESILEVGCGQGRCLEIVRQYFPQSRLLGVDFSTTAIAAARSRFPEGTFHVGVAEDLSSIPNESVNLVLNIEVLEHVADARKTVREFARVLKPGGRALVTTPCANSLSLEWTANFLARRLQKMPDGFHRFGTDPPEHIRRLNSKELNEIMMEAGLTLDWIRFRAHLFTWPSYVASRLVRHFLPVFGEIAFLDWRLFRWLTNG